MKKSTKGLLRVGMGISFLGAAAFLFRERICVAGIRRTFWRSDEKRDRGLTTPERIHREDDIPYGKDPQQVMDIYYPKGTCEKLPVIVSIHGGGYVYGDKERYQYYCMDLAQRGFAVVNFTYRLAPEHRFPAQLKDLNSVMNFICRHREEYYIDTDNVFFVGDSAGAQMNSQYSAAVTNPAYAKLLGLDIPDFCLRAIGLNCGIYEMDLTSTGIANISRYYLGRQMSGYREKMDVLANITAGYPPCFVVSSTGDFLLKHAEPMGEFLTQKGIENEVHIYGTEEDRPGHVFHCDLRNDFAKQCNDEECTFFKKHISSSAVVKDKGQEDKNESV